MRSKLSSRKLGLQNHYTAQPGGRGKQVSHWEGMEANSAPPPSYYPGTHTNLPSRPKKAPPPPPSDNSDSSQPPLDDDLFSEDR